MVVKLVELVVKMEIEGPVSVRLVYSACLGKHGHGWGSGEVSLSLRGKQRKDALHVDQ